MVFCRECKKKVEDCEHFVAPLGIPAVAVFDPKIKSLAYKRQTQTLEIAFKNGQIWQLFGVPPAIHDTLLQQTLSSFLKFIAPKYKAAPVRTSGHTPAPCPACKRPMQEQHRTTVGALRILWHCPRCNQSLWRNYRTESVRERKERWH
jgi:KTSC domain